MARGGTGDLLFMLLACVSVNRAIVNIKRRKLFSHLREPRDSSLPLLQVQKRQARKPAPQKAVQGLKRLNAYYPIPSTVVLNVSEWYYRRLRLT